MLLVPINSENTLLETMLNKTPAEDLVLRLYSNNKTPSSGDVAASYTEVVGAGYAAMPLVGSGWNIATGTAEFAEQSFIFSSANGLVYGYYLTQAVSGLLMWAERFSDGPYNISNLGDTIKLTPRISLD
jgi:hypothetical protein